MPDFKQSLTLAIQAEVMSQNLYRMLAASYAKRPEVSSIFTNLIPMERIHEEKLTVLFGQHFPGTVPDIDIVHFRKPVKVNIEGPQKVLEFAISREEMAHDNYSRLASYATDPATKELFTSLAFEEENHKSVLQTEILRLDNLMTWFDPSELNGLVED
jgi:rubrerythrin